MLRKLRGKLGLALINLGIRCLPEDHQGAVMIRNMTRTGAIKTK